MNTISASRKQLRPTSARFIGWKDFSADSVYCVDINIQRPTRLNGKNTIQVLREFSRRELDRVGPVEFNLDRVLSESGVSRSSVYHHFGSRDGLVAVVALDQFSEKILNDVRRVKGLAAEAQTPLEFMHALTLGFTTGHNSKARRQRQARIASFAAAEKNPVLRDSMKRTQIHGTQEFEQVLVDAQSRKLIKPTASITGIAYLMQSMLVGRIVPDITESREIDDKWLEASLMAISVLLGIPTPPASR